MVSSSLFAALFLSGFAAPALAQAPLWGQCGGRGWTGATTCVSGACCTYTNEWYSQCLPGNCAGATTTRASSTIRTTSIGTPTGTSSAPTTSPTGGGSAGCGANPLASGTYSLTINGQNRQYILRVPDNYDRNQPYKLIFGFHWLGGTMTDVATGQTIARDTWAYYGLQRLANNTAIFIAPQGLNNGWPNTGDQDLAFVDAILRTVEAGLCVNTRLRFSTGFSYGGGMSYSLACSRANVFRAVAVIAGAQLSGCTGGTTPIAYLGTHGIRDEVLNISMGRQLRDTFVRNNGCTSQSPSEPSQGSLSHIKTTYSGCRAGYPVVWIPFDSGHNPAPVDGSTGSGGQTWVPGETWSFFSQFT